MARIFVSYARNDLQGGELEQVLQELEKDLKVRRGVKEDSLFRDLDDIDLLEDWSEALGAALASPGLMIAICSPSYLASVPCGKEYGVFLDRAEEVTSRTSQTCRAILPIIWMPPDGEWPDVIGRYQYTNSQLPESYLRYGLRQLFRLRRYQEDGLITVSVLAEALCDSLRQPLPAWNRLRRLKEARDAFRFSTGSGAASGYREATFTGPKVVRAVVAVGKRIELESVRTMVTAYSHDGRLWQPYLPDSSRPIGAEVQRLAGEMGLLCEFIEVNQDVCERIKTAAEEYEIVLVVADPWTLRLESYARHLRGYDQLYLLNCALLMVWNPKDAETVEKAAELGAALEDVFRNKFQIPPPGHLFRGIDDHQGFALQVTRALTETQLRIVDLASRHRRAEHTGLREAAAREGIDVATRAVLHGPVGASG
jgi:FxsC-like protein